MIRVGLFRGILRFGWVRSPLGCRRSSTVAERGALRGRNLNVSGLGTPWVLARRHLGLGGPLFHGGADDEALSGETDSIPVQFILKDGSVRKVMAKRGERALYLAHR